LIRDLRAHVRKCGDDGREGARVHESVGESEPAGERETKGGREKEDKQYSFLSVIRVHPRVSAAKMLLTLVYIYIHTYARVYL